MTIKDFWNEYCEKYLKCLNEEKKIEVWKDIVMKYAQAFNMMLVVCLNPNNSETPTPTEVGYINKNLLGYKRDTMNNFFGQGARKGVYDIDKLAKAVGNIDEEVKKKYSESPYYVERNNKECKNNTSIIKDVIKLFRDKKITPDCSVEEFIEFLKNNLVFDAEQEEFKKGCKDYLDIIIKNKKNEETSYSINYLEILRQSKQMILCGPPGSGKTRLAKILAAQMVTGNEENKEIKKSEDQNETKNKEDIDYCKKTESILNNECREYEGRIRLLQFHPSYGYENIITGIGIELENDVLRYVPKNGAVKEIADKAAEDKEKVYVLIIDEINRAPLASVMGELLYALEKREEEIEIPGSERGERLIIPENLYIIGTMNTADRSLNSMDYAMRRRFAFVNIYSRELNKREIEILKSESKEFALSLYKKVNKLFSKKNNERIVVEGVNPDDICLGEAYFIYQSQKPEHLRYKLNYEIIPILMEYYKDGFFLKKKKISGEETIRDIFESNKKMEVFLRSEDINNLKEGKEIK